MSTVIVIIAAVALMIFVNGLYVAAEFATVSSRRTRISQMAGGGNKMAEMLRPIMENTAALDTYVAARLALPFPRWFWALMGRM